MKPDLTLWEKLPEHHGPIPPIDSIATIESVRVDNIAKLSRLVQNFDQNIPGLQFAYDRLRADCARMGSILEQMERNHEAAGSAAISMPLLKRKIHLRFQNSYAIILHLALTLHHGLDHAGALGDTKEGDLDFYTKESIKLTQNSMQYRPLGSSNVPFCLVMAYALTKDDLERIRMGDMLDEWEGDFDATNWRGVAEHAMSRLHEGGWLHLTAGKF
jgi:hypothetical protein